MTYAYQCGPCDYDLCGECYYPCEECIQAEREQVLSHLSRLCAEKDDLVTKEEELATNDAIVFKDAQLTRLRLAGVLQRFREKRPDLEDLALRQEDEIDELVAEIQQLREENLQLALAARASDGGKVDGIGGDSDQICKLSQWRADALKRQRQTKVSEFRLGNLRLEMQATARQLRDHDKQLKEMRRRHAEASSLAAELGNDVTESCKEVERGRHAVQELHSKALSARKACYAPAELKRKSSILMKFLDQEGGRLNMEKHFRSLQANSKLYAAITAQAPALQTLAGRAKASMEAEFEKYQSLARNHTEQLHRLHLMVTRGLLNPATLDAAIS